jgi:hypothetical protein
MVGLSYINLAYVLTIILMTCLYSVIYIHISGFVLVVLPRHLFLLYITDNT